MSIAAVQPFSRAEVDGTLIDRWRVVADACGDAIAVVDQDGTETTYRELDRHASAVARAYRSLHPQAPEPTDPPVLVLGGQNVATLVAALGAWKAGVIVTVLDSLVPDARLQALVEASGAATIIVEPAMRGRAESLGLESVVVIPDPDPLGGDDTVWEGPAPGMPAAVAFTSGSTGVPKGVVVPHRAGLHEYWMRAESGWAGPSIRAAGVLPLGFLAGLGESVGVLLGGGQVLLYEPRVGGTSSFVEWLASSGVTDLSSTPSLLLAAGEQLAPGAVLSQSLRRVRCVGERTLARDARRLFERLPSDCLLINAYGATETGVVTQYVVPRDIADNNDPIPAGHPIPDCDVRLVEDHEDVRVVARGIDRGHGRLVVRSAFTATGYYRDPESTAGTFTPIHEIDGPEAAAEHVLVVASSDLLRRDEQGLYHTLGRSDHTVKIRGYRVEPAEVESVLLDYEDIAECIVVGEVRDTGSTRLIAYVVGKDGAEIRAAAVRRWMRERVGSYMIPECMIQLTTLPRSERGKLDRSALPAPPARPAPYVPVRTDWELVLADLWKEILDVDEVGLEDDFFALGGDSLAAEELLTRLENEYNTDLDSRSLVEAPTLGEFAHQAVRRGDGAHPTLVALRREGTTRPLFCVAGAGGLALSFLPFVRQLPAEMPVWGLQAKGLESRICIPDWSVRRIAARHVRAMRSVQPEGPYRIVGHSFGGIIAFEMCHQLKAAGQDVDLLVLMDSLIPDLSIFGKQAPLPLRARLRDAAAVAVTGLVPTPGYGHYRRFHRQALTLTRLYRGAKAWSGRTLVVSAADSGLPGCNEEWGEYLSGDWTLESVAGNHDAILRSPYVDRLAAIVSEELERVMRRAAEPVAA